jgi:hypothetical protein
MAFYTLLLFDATVDLLNLACDNQDPGNEWYNCRAQPGCRVYVGNLSWEAAWQDLKDHMRGPDVSVLTNFRLLLCNIPNRTCCTLPQCPS